MPAADAGPLAFLLSPIYSGALAPEHLADLRRSRLSDETIRLHGLRSVPPGMIGRLLGFDVPDIRSAMLIPFPDPAGGFLPHTRLKRFPPGQDHHGHTVKYLQPRRSSVRLYFPRPTLGAVLQSPAPLWCLEGEKKALAVGQLGLPAVGFCGIEGWHRAGSRELLRDFDVIPLRGRIVEVVPDGDVAINPNVERGAFRLMEALERRGARTRLVLLPLEVAA
jgi:hypothetical protein